MPKRSENKISDNLDFIFFKTSIPNNIHTRALYYNCYLGFSLVNLVTSESYPTNLRSQAVGVSSSVSRIFCAVAPFLGNFEGFLMQH